VRCEWHVNVNPAPLSLAIQGGVPHYWAVLLDNTNFGGAGWTAYTSSNITANLGTNQGWHTVWVGLSRQPALPFAVQHCLLTKIGLRPARTKRPA
jgi:hypothetical protein